jgi:hypothetical protein
MRRLLTAVLIVAFAVFSLPMGVMASSARKASLQQGGAITGVARDAAQKPLPKFTVRVRSVSTGQIAGSTTSSQAGEFSFTGLAPANYVVEIVDAAGNVVGLSPAVAVTTGATVSVTVSASAAGALTGAAGGGFSLFGLGPLASVAVIGAAGAVAVTAVVATKNDASPSR